MSGEYLTISTNNVYGTLESQQTRGVSYFRDETVMTGGVITEGAESGSYTTLADDIDE